MKPELIISKYQQLKANAENRNLEFDLTLRSVENLLKAKKCHYTGKPFTFGVTGKGAVERTVDRVDPKKGYVKGNVVAFSLQFNQLKNYVEHSSKEEQLRFVKQLAKVVNRI